MHLPLLKQYPDGQLVFTENVTPGSCVCLHEIVLEVIDAEHEMRVSPTPVTLVCELFS